MFHIIIICASNATVLCREMTVLPLSAPHSLISLQIRYTYSLLSDVEGNQFHIIPPPLYSLNFIFWIKIPTYSALLQLTRQFYLLLFLKGCNLLVPIWQTDLKNPILKCSIQVSRLAEPRALVPAIAVFRPHNEELISNTTQRLLVSNQSSSQ